MAAPHAFTGLTFEQALERSRANKSILIVDAMAAWCGPCRQMDATTWADDAVVKRLTSGGPFAIQIDVDEEEELAAQLDIQSMPTLIAFASGVEHDRLVGGRGPKEFLEWLEMVERGERYEDAQRAKRAARYERRTRAPKLLAAKQYDEALADYTWLWTEARDEKLVDEIRELVDAHPPAREAFTKLRDASPPNAEQLEGVFVWILLNRILGDADATLDWYAKSSDDLPPTQMVATLVEVTIIPLMIARGRWAAAGAALANPDAAFTHLAEERPADFREQTANLVRALYAAGRDERASDLEFQAENVDASKEMAAALATAKTLGREDRAKR